MALLVLGPSEADGITEWQRGYNSSLWRMRSQNNLYITDKNGSSLYEIFWNRSLRS